MMEGRRWLLLLALVACLFSSSSGREWKYKHKVHSQSSVYNHTLATILVRYASTVYLSDLTELFSWTCDRCNGLIKDFQMMELIVDIQHCLQAFVGVATDPNAIIIAFKGTQGNSIQNWIEDLFWKQLDIDYPGMPDAMVHHGFYNAYHNTTIRPGILNAVARAKEFYGDLGITVTGHSMGGAMASFCALDLRFASCCLLVYRNAASGNRRTNGNLTPSRRAKLRKSASPGSRHMNNFPIQKKKVIPNLGKLFGGKKIENDV